MNSIEILKNIVFIPENMVLIENKYNDQYSTVELQTKDGVPFKMFYYIVNTITHRVYYGGYEVPTSVTVERIIRGYETALN